MSVQSRCGLLCSECGYKEETGCKGCLHMDKPFWGESCPIKVCCEDNKLEHCGACDQFPCELLNQFSYDKKQGDDGRRIRQCGIWACSSQNK